MYRILFVHNYYTQGGGEDYALKSERILMEKQGYLTNLVVADNKKIRTFLQKFKTARDIIYSEEEKKNIFGIVSKIKPDIVHVHNFFPVFTPSIYYACAENGVPVIQTLHNYRTICAGALLMRNGKICENCITGSPYQAMVHRCYRNSVFGSWAVARMVAYHRKNKTWQNKVDRFIALTEFAKQKFIEAGFPERKIAVKPNYYSDDNCTIKDNMNERKGALFVGRLSMEKGISTLLAAWQRGLPISLRIAGDGPLFEKAKVQPYPHIKFLGRLVEKTVSVEMLKASFLVMPSICYETFGLVIIEAYAHRLPVVASRIGSMAEIVADGKTGLHFEPGNPVDLAEKARWMFEHPEECRRMGENARKEYEEKYTPEKNYQQLMAIYQDVIEEYKRGRR